MKKSLSALLMASVITLCCGLLACDANSGQTGTEGTGTDSSTVDDSLTYHGSPHHSMDSVYAKFGVKTEAEWDSMEQIIHHVKHEGDFDLHPDYKTFGWHPYYTGSAYKAYNFSLLWGVAYFAYDIEPKTGSYTTIHSWKTTALVDSAKKHGTKVFLTVKSFGGANNSTFLRNPTARQTCIDSIIALVEYRDANGVNVDLEGVRASDKDSLTAFMVALSQQLKLKDPTHVVSLALYSVDWNNVFDIPNLVDYVDLFMIMGYDYYYSGSSKAGPVAPKESGKEWLPYNLEKSVAAYLEAGVPKNQLLLGVPYYGRSWYTSTTAIPGATTGHKKDYSYRQIMDNGWDASAKMDSVSSTKYSVFNGTETYQVWFEDRATLSAKWDIVLDNDLAGGAIWSLGMDNGYTDLWELLEEKFTESEDSDN